MVFDETYFKSSNYTNYLERKIRYKKIAQELIAYLSYLKILLPNSKLLDYGCAVGFLVCGFREQKYQCEGYDISDWSKEEAKKYGIEFIPLFERKFDIMFALDVFEHMSDIDIEKALQVFNPDTLIVRIPCSTDGGKRFHLDISRKDPTHINCKTKQQWIDFFTNHRYVYFDCVDLYTVYDTDGVMCYICKK